MCCFKGQRYIFFRFLHDFSSMSTAEGGSTLPSATGINRQLKFPGFVLSQILLICIRDITCDITFLSAFSCRRLWGVEMQPENAIMFALSFSLLAHLERTASPHDLPTDLNTQIQRIISVAGFRFYFSVLKIFLSWVATHF